MSDTPWLSRFPDLDALEPSARDLLERSGRVIGLAAGARVFGPGQAPQGFLLLLEGSVRVQQSGDNGREIILYRVQTGESCALTTACLLGFDDYPAEAITEVASRAVTVPRAVFDELIGRSPVFRRFVFSTFSARVAGLLRLVDEIAFQRLDLRLAARLIALAAGGQRIETTHQQLAAELGTAREVVSRLLHEFQRRGLLSVGRGTIEILDRAALGRLACDH